MPRTEIDYRDYFRPTVEALASGGMLLVATDESGHANPMTIGWGTLGTIWGKSICMVMVRPSRFTYNLMNNAGDFTVNLLPKSMADAVSLCGTKSGRDLDKLAATGLTVSPSTKVSAPGLAQATLVLECRTVNVTDLNPDTLDPGIRSRAYPNGDFHRLYFGEIVAAFADVEQTGQ